MNTHTKQANPKYTLDFKQDAARFVNEKGYTYQKVADHLGISLSVIRRWSRVESEPYSPVITGRESSFKSDRSS